MEINFDKIKAFSVVIFIQLICGVIVPGFLFIFIFNKNLFLSLDLFRLTTLAISVTAPILTINCIIMLIGFRMGDKGTPSDDVFHRIFASAIYLGSILTIIVTYTSIIIGFFFNLKLRQGIFILLMAEIIIIIIMIITMRLEPKSENVKK